MTHEPHPYRGNDFAGRPCLECGLSLELRMVHPNGRDPIDEFDDLPDDAPLPGTDQPATPDPGNAPIREDDPNITERLTIEEREP